MEAREIFLVVTGANKRDVVEKLYQENGKTSFEPADLKAHRMVNVILDKEAAAGLPEDVKSLLYVTLCLIKICEVLIMSKDKDPKLNYHEEENSMVNDFEDLKELGKEMEQISDQNDQEKNSEEESQ